MITDIQRKTKTTFEICTNVSLSLEDRQLAQRRLKDLFSLANVELGETVAFGTKRGAFVMIEIEDCNHTNAEIKRIVEGVFRAFVH